MSTISRQSESPDLELPPLSRSASLGLFLQTVNTKFDVRGSASITDLADNVFTVWRNKPKEAERDNGGSSRAGDSDCLLIVDKCRHGTWEGRIQLWYDMPSQSFVGHEHEQPKAMRFDDTTEVEF